MKKISKTLSNILIFGAIVIGYVLAFKTKAPQYSFYFYAVSSALIAIYSLFVFLGTKKNKETVVDILEKAKDSGLAEIGLQIISKKPLQTVQTTQIPTNIAPTNINQRS